MRGEDFLLLRGETSPLRMVSEVLLNELVQRGITITVAEGCTGGAIIDALTIPGATRAFHFGCVAYSLDSKVKLGVPPAVISSHGEYSVAVAKHMAQAAGQFHHDSLAVSVVGDMDPVSDQPTREMFVAYTMNGKAPWGTSLLLSPQSKRVQIKEQLAVIALSGALLYLRDKPDEIKAMADTFLPVRDNWPDFDTKIYSRANELVNTLLTRGLTLGVMESCTGGAVANAITNVRGASRVLNSSWVAYDEDVKARLGVPMTAMVNGSVYSRDVALQMAKAIRRYTGVDLAIATTGVMENMDTRPFHSDSKPGTVCIAVEAENKKSLVRDIKFPVRSREEMKTDVVDKALYLALTVVSQPELQPQFLLEQIPSFS